MLPDWIFLGNYVRRWSYILNRWDICEIIKIGQNGIMVKDCMSYGYIVGFGQIHENLRTLG